MTPPSTLTLTDAILLHLEDAGLVAGDAEKPAGGGWQGTPAQSEFRGYVVLFPGSARTDGPVGDVNADVWITYRAMAIGDTRRTCEAVADLTRAAFSTGFDRDGYWVSQPFDVFLGDVRRDDMTQPPLFVATDTYDLYTTPH